MTLPANRLRPATAQDASAIAAIWNEAIEQTVATVATRLYDLPRMEALIAQRQTQGRAFIVAERHGRVVGFATYDQFRSAAGYDQTMEHSIYLDGAARGSGAARDLMTAIEDHARGAGHRLMIGVVSGENTRALRFHLALGYQDYGRIPACAHKFGRMVDIHFLCKALQLGS